MILGIDHVGIAVRKLAERLPFWSEALGLSVSGVETVASEGVTVAFLPVGEARVELLESAVPDSAIARHLERRGEGIHHLTLAVDDIEGLLARLRAREIEILGHAARAGAEGSLVAFLHPRATGGVLVELVERRPAERVQDGSIEPGSTVLIYLRQPQEKLWGVLRRLDSAGVSVEGIDLGSFDDWIAQIERGEEDIVGPSMLFVPMGRVEKVLLDRSSGDLLSLADRFRQRTGRTVRQVLGDS